MSQYEMLSADHPIVKKIAEQNGIKPGANGEPAVPQGSKVRLPKVSEPLAPEPTGKEISVKITVQQEARAIRESAIRGMTVPEYLSSILSEKLQADIGAPVINGASFMAGGGGKKVTVPGNSVRRVTNGSD